MRSLTFTKTVGAGAFGTVYRAELSTGQGFSRRVAVKIISGDHAEKEMFITRMRDEARLLGLLQDDHILKVLDLLSVKERDAIVMEYIDGVDLSDALSAGHLPPLRTALEIGAVVAATLHRAHSATHPHSGEPLGVVHRDVKPANVMITASGNLKLLDFGVAQARFAARESQTGQMVLGTLNYMAPDYIISGEVTPAIDVYGLGLTLFELCTGDVFGQPTLREDRHNVRLAERLKRLDPAHPEIGELMARMLHWSPDARPSCTECEHRLLQLADSVRGTGLRQYAAALVPALLAARPPQPDREDLLGSTIQLGRANLSTPVADDSIQPQPATIASDDRDTGDAPTTIADRGLVSSALEPFTGETASPVRPQKIPQNEARRTGYDGTRPATSHAGAAFRGIALGGFLGVLAVGILAVVLFYGFPPSSLP